MRKILTIASLAVTLLFAAPGSFAAPPAKAAPGTIVIVFKDGHRQTYNLADVERVEFPTSEMTSASSASGPSRGHFLGKWEVGDGSGNNFFITLREDGDAFRTLGDVHGKWAYFDGEARVTWDDGAQDALRKVGSNYQKFAYASGKSFTDTPDNVTKARNTTSNPI